MYETWVVTERIFTVIGAYAWEINIEFFHKRAELNMGGSMGSHPQTEEVMDDKGLLLMNFSYKSLTLRLYNELYKKILCMCLGLVILDGILESCQWWENRETRKQSEGDGKWVWENKIIQGSYIMCRVVRGKILDYLEPLIRL